MKEKSSFKYYFLKYKNRVHLLKATTLWIWFPSLHHSSKMCHVLFQAGSEAILTGLTRILDRNLIIKH